MFASSCRESALAVLLLALLGSLIAGCGQPVREDRSINWSKQGQAVGFQHGKEGVFVADSRGSGLTKVFQPGADVIATSSPLWSPTGERMMFTTARATNNQPTVNFSFLPGLPDPAGAIHEQRDIVYTCWVHEKDKDGQASKPVALFEAACNHVGYVAANLAVRWHPSGKAILFVKQMAGGEHALFEYDLDSKQSRRVFPFGSEALIFDWAPDGSQLVCVLGSRQKRESDGIWIGRPGEENWWHVPHSGNLACAELPSVLESLRTTRAAWTSDSTRFAFVSFHPGKSNDQPGRYSLHLGTLATHRVEILTDGTELIRDLHWKPDGQRLGVVLGGPTGTLHTVSRGAPLSEPLNREPVRRFAGWNATGTRLAYIVPDKMPFVDGDLWAFLLVPDPMARDAVIVSGGADKDRAVFSGMRATFPQWSPKEDSLSLWVTFSPTFRSWLSLLLGWGLRPGDPAAVFDLRTGELGWMAMNPQEKVQIGHYYLLKRDYLRAWQWYTEAERELPPAKPAKAADLAEYLQALQGPRDFSFFQYYCLTKLGRRDEAEHKLERFEGNFLPKLAGHQSNREPSSLDPRLVELLDSKGVFAALVRDLYAAEVFLSLDAAEDGEAFFRQRLAEAKADPARLSSALVLSQILLVEKKHSAYAKLMTDAAGPLFFKLDNLPAGNAGSDPLNPEALQDFVVLFALLPLFSSEFQKGLPPDQVQEMARLWQALQAKARTKEKRQLADLALQAAYRRLGMDKELQGVRVRLQENASSFFGFTLEADVDKTIGTIRKGLQEIFQRR